MHNIYVDHPLIEKLIIKVNINVVFFKVLTLSFES